jgi:hypothetical protein
MCIKSFTLKSQTMKKILFFLCFGNVLIFNNSCQKSNQPEPDTIPAAVIARVQSLNLSTSDLKKTDGGYIAEQDIFLSNEFLASDAKMTHYTTLHEDHYRTSNLVTGLPRTISARYTGTLSVASNAINTALARFNALGPSFSLRFQRVTSTSPANITFSDVSGVAYIAISGFPSGGNPYNSIRFNTAYAIWPSATLATLFAHEIGHCIGFGHTDAVDNISCPPGTPGGGISGLILIPGTPPLGAGDPNSWMMRCISAGIDRPFTVIDRFALNFVY